MRRSHVLAIAFALACAPSFTSLGSIAHAQTADAKQAFDEAVDTEKRGEYEKALERFKKVEALKPTPGVLFHEAYCLEMLGKLAPAYVTYERAEEMARAQKKQEVVNAVQARLVPLAQRVPLINITADPKEAEVRVDGQVVTNLSVRVDPGEHEVAASAPGHTTKKLRMPMREGMVQSVALTLEPTTATATPVATGPTASSTNASPSNAAPPPPLTEPPRDDPKSGSMTVPIIVTTGAVAFLAAGVVTFLLAGSAQSDAKKTCPTKVSCDDEQSKVRTLDAFALSGFIGGVGLGALAVVLWAGRSSGSAKVTASGSTLLLQGEF